MAFRSHQLSDRRRHRDRRTCRGTAATLSLLALTSLALVATPVRAEWEIVDSGTTADLHGFGTFFGLWLAGEDGTLLRSLDSGATWSPVTTGVTASLRAIHQPSSSNYWIAGDGGTVIVSLDGGTSWLPRGVPQPADLTAIFSRSSGVAYAIGSDGSIFRSDNVGEDWEIQSSGTSADLLSGICPLGGATNTAIVGGVGGVLLKTTDGGETWAPRSSGTSADIRGFTTGSAGVIVAVCADGVILQSADTGETWEEVDTPLSADIYAIDTSGTAANVMTACGAGGLLLKSTTSGASWFAQASPTSAHLFAATTPTNSVHVAAGAGGTIVRTTDGGGDPVSVEDQAVLPSALVLASSRPNPFNPRTVIAFTLTVPRPTRVEVFDLAGRRVALLSDGWRQAGSHEVVFATADLASGAYIYRVTAGSEHVAGKLLLQK